jgi:hypothetical protein
MDHIALLAKSCNQVTILLFHNSDAFMADQIKNQLIATHIILHIKFHIPNHIHSIFSSINHHNIEVLCVRTSLAFTVVIILTSTVDILTAKQIIAGEKIIPTKFQIVK